ncbi:hypothetical protein YC2023_101562 [Brassica napus]
MWLGKSILSKALTLAKKQLESLYVSSLIHKELERRLLWFGQFIGQLKEIELVRYVESYPVYFQIRFLKKETEGKADRVLLADKDFKIWYGNQVKRQ